MTSVIALLGPTNTGKTHRAIERMLDHDTGMIGLPLRLLAREVYDKVSARVGESRVALVTGEERRVPRSPSYWVCTVEAMPVEREVDFVAVDEIQLAAHDQRGHVFTDRLLRARGRQETMFLGSESMRGVLEALVPVAKVAQHPRLSRLTAVESVPLQRVPVRSAVVAFSMPQVYELAERLRALRGGAAVVLGALSPRTRNAQVAMFQAGEVDHLVATDAIGMGLNLDVRHVAFASLRKFDGRVARELDPAELAQIAGRAGRYLHDGTFGAVSPLTVPLDLQSAIEQHRFPAVRRVWWRPHAIDFHSVDDLLASLRVPSPRHVLRRVLDAEDERALAAMLERPAVRERADTPARVRLLWEVCSVPDFPRLLFEAHVETLAALYVELTDRGALGDAWLAAQVDRLDDTDGDVETLVGRIAAVRTWTYVTQRDDWVAHPTAWQERARVIEDRLSDALHARLVLRFVDEPAMRRPRPVARPSASRTSARDEAHEVSRGHPFAKLQRLRDALAPVVVHTSGGDDLDLDALIEAPHERFTLGGDGVIRDGARTLARVVAGTSLAQPDAVLVGMDAVPAGARARLLRRMVAFARDAAQSAIGLRRGVEVTTAMRGIVYRVEQGLGTVSAREVRPLVASLTDAERAGLDAMDVWLGRAVVQTRASTGAEALRLRATLVSVHRGVRLRAPDGGTVSMGVISALDDAAHAAMGYPRVGPRAVRADVVERAAEALAADDVDEAAVAGWTGVARRESQRVLDAIRALMG